MLPKDTLTRYHFKKSVGSQISIGKLSRAVTYNIWHLNTLIRSAYLSCGLQGRNPHHLELTCSHIALEVDTVKHCLMSGAMLLIR
jgi:hypothetical protein